MLVGLQVKDVVAYSNYRKAMIPILKTFGGGFRYDFKVSETIINDEGRPINRVFAILFKDKDSMNSFFQDDEYKKIKTKLFETSVETTTIITEYARD